MCKLTSSNPMKSFMRWILPIAVAVIVTLPAHAVERVRYIHTDALGSPAAATDENGELVWRERYRPYGQRMLNASDDNRVWFTGKLEQPEIGLSYFGARWYDPIVGRFAGIDPVSYQEGNIHSFNRYGYANNNPYGYTDPDGEAAQALGACAAGSALGGPIGCLVLGGASLWGTYQVGKILGQNSASGSSDGSFGGLTGGTGDPCSSGLCDDESSTSPRQYKMGRNDLDWRGKNLTYRDALDEAFRRTGVDRGRFEITRWSKDANGKSFPSEWRHRSGAEVNMDLGHRKHGPTSPHIGWQTGGKRGGGGAQRGHILVDDVPYNR